MQILIQVSLHFPGIDRSDETLKISLFHFFLLSWRVSVENKKTERTKSIITDDDTENEFHRIRTEQTTVSIRLRKPKVVLTDRFFCAGSDFSSSAVAAVSVLAGVGQVNPRTVLTGWKRCRGNFCQQPLRQRPSF